MKKIISLLALSTLAISFTNNKTNVIAKDEIGFNQSFVINEEEILNDFNSYYFLNDASSGLYGNGWYQAQTSFSDLWSFTSSGLAKKTNMTDLGLGGGGMIFQNWQNWASLNSKDCYDKFIVESTFKFSKAKFNAGNSLFEGRAGIQFNFTNETQIPVYLGGVAFLIEPSNGALVYRKDGNAEQASDVSYYNKEAYGNKDFNREEYLTLKIEVSNTSIKAYVDDVLRLEIARDDLLTSTKIGLASTCNDVYYKDLKITPNGEEAKYYNFVKENLYDENFKSYFYQWGCGYGTNDWDQVSLDNDLLWGLTSNGLARSTAKDKLGWMPDSSSNYAWLNKNNLSSFIYEGKSYKNVEIETTINFDTLATSGMAGVQFSVTDNNLPVYWTNGYASYIDSSDGTLYLRSGVSGTSTILASSSYDSSSYEDKSYDKKKDSKIVVKAYGSTLLIYVDGVERINYQLNSLEGHGLSSGYVGLYADNNSSFFKSLSIKDLTSSGEVCDVLPTSISINDITNPIVANSYELVSSVSPSDASQEVVYSCDSSLAFINDNHITFLKEGDVVVTCSSLVDQSIKNEITYHVNEADVTYHLDLSKQDDVNELIPYFIDSTSTHPLQGYSDILTNNYEVTSTGLNRISTREITSVDSNYAYLYLKGKYEDFELTYSFNDNNSSDGWCGLVFAKETYNSSIFSYSVTNSNAVRIDEKWQGYSCLGSQIGPSSDSGNEYAPHSNYKKGQDNLVKVRVYGSTFELYLNDMSTPVVNKQVEDSKKGYVGLFANLASNEDMTTFKDIYLTILNSDGSKATYNKASEIVWNEQNTNGYVNEAIRLNASVDGSQSFVNYVSCDPSIAYINGNYVYFIKEGSVDIKATHVDRINEVSKTFTVSNRTYDNSIIFDSNTLTSYFQQGEEAGSAIKEELANHYLVSDGKFTRINDLGGAVSINFAELYLDKKYSSFELIYKLKADVGVGWQGIMLGKTSYTNSFFFDGDGAYISLNDSHATLWGQTVGNHSDLGNEALAHLYDLNNYNTIKFKVYGVNGVQSNRVIEIYVNDMDNPVVSNYLTSAPVEGYICIFSTGSTSTIKDIRLNYLNSNGEAINYVGVETIAIENKVNEIEKGSKLTLNIKVSPENSTVKEYTYKSSDKSIAIINDEGVVSFINSGEVTISVISKDNEEIVDSMTIKVVSSLKSIEVTNKISSAKVNDTLKLEVKFNPSDANNKDVIYSSSDESIATIDSDGNVSFIKKGKVTIKVTSKNDSSISYSFDVEVSKNSGCNSSMNSSIVVIIFALVLIALLKKASNFYTKF